MWKEREHPGEGATLSKASDIEAVVAAVHAWFAEAPLTALLRGDAAEAQRVGRDWLMTGGNRWRPMLTAAVYEAAGGELARIRAAAVAVECFHKASLIHDDIEDGDDERYGVLTVHRRVGVPAAINVGDFLVGEGYRLLLESDFPAEVRAELGRVAACGHRALSLGQGEELAFCREPAPVTEEAVLKIYERKTAAAFEVAVRVGAAAAGVDAATSAQLSVFSRAVGTAYQIQDDMADFRSVRGRAADMLALRPTLFLAVACGSDNAVVREAVAAVWDDGAPAREHLMAVIRQEGLHERVEGLYARYRDETEQALAALHHTELKRLLRRIMAKMLR